MSTTSRFYLFFIQVQNIAIGCFHNTPWIGNYDSPFNTAVLLPMSTIKLGQNRMADGYPKGDH